MNRTTVGSTGRVDKMLLFEKKKKKICKDVVIKSTFVLTYLFLYNIKDKGLSCLSCV